MNSPPASFTPRLREAAITPELLKLSSLILGSVNELTTSTVSSVEKLFTTIASQSLKVCAKTESSAFFSNFAWLYVGITTETNGL